MHNDRRTGVFVDVQNIYYTCRQAFGKQFNYRACWQYLSDHYNISFANAYAISPVDDAQHKFQDALSHIGFNVKRKPYIQRRDGSSKGDWDVGITIDVMLAAPELDEIILLSGDGDFDMLLNTVQNKYDVSTTVFSVQSLTADSLLAATQHFLPISKDFLQ